MINVAMLSFWHVHADDYKKCALQHPKVKIVAVWDEIKERGTNKAQELDVPFYSDLDELLSNPEIHGVIVDAPTNLHHSVISRAVKAKKHVFTEKVVTPGTKEVLEIDELVKENNVKFTVSLPRVNTWYTQTILEQLAQGVIGKVTSSKVHLAHNGSLSSEAHPNGWLPEHFYSLEECLGGALIDLGCHPVYLTRLFLGMPKSVYTEFGYFTNREVEDISTSIFQTDNGALGTVEVSFVNSKSPFSIEVHGTDGCITFSEATCEVKINTINKDITLLEKDFTGEITEDFDQWVMNIEGKSDLKSNLDLGIELTKLMEACYESQKLGKKIQIGN